MSRTSNGSLHRRTGRLEEHAGHTDDPFAIVIGSGGTCPVRGEELTAAQIRKRYPGGHLIHILPPTEEKVP